MKILKVLGGLASTVGGMVLAAYCIFFVPNTLLAFTGFTITIIGAAIAANALKK